MVNFEEMLRRCMTLNKPLQDAGAGEEVMKNLRDMQMDIAALVAAERRPEDELRLPNYLFELLRSTLQKNMIRSGVIAEIGGGINSFLPKLGKFDFKFLTIFPSNDPQYIVADICNCPHVPTDSFDVVFSKSVLEHVTNIHDAAREIVRVLKPGGITMHAVPFSYFFHQSPDDYWRLTTSALESVFAELETIECFFYADNRRRNNVGTSVNRVDQYGGAKFAPDAFGGWRENWFSIYIGRKLPNGVELLHERRVKQALVDIVKGLIEGGASEEDAIARALVAVRHISFDSYGRVLVNKEPAQRQLFGIGLPELTDIWAKRSKDTVRPSTARSNLMAILSHAGLV